MRMRFLAKHRAGPGTLYNSDTFDASEASYVGTVRLMLAILGKIREVARGGPLLSTKSAHTCSNLLPSARRKLPCRMMCSWLESNYSFDY